MSNNNIYFGALSETIKWLIFSSIYFHAVYPFFNEVLFGFFLVAFLESEVMLY